MRGWDLLRLWNEYNTVSHGGGFHYISLHLAASDSISLHLTAWQ